MTFGFNNCNNFGIGMPTGMGMGLAPGSSVKITQTTTGGPSVFTGRQFYQGGGCGSNITSIDIQHGPSGFLGGALGFLQGLGGRCMTGWNNMCSNFNLGGWGMNGGYGFGAMQMPDFTQGLNIGTGTSAYSGLTSFGNADPSSKAIANFKEIGGSEWKAVVNPDGTFTAKIDGKYTDDGNDKSVTGDYQTVLNTITATKKKATTQTTNTGEQQA